MLIILQKLTNLKGFYRKTKIDYLNSWTPCISYQIFSPKKSFLPFCSKICFHLLRISCTLSCIKKLNVTVRIRNRHTTQLLDFLHCAN